jgi:predicted site-specific integrase-resolvase
MSRLATEKEAADSIGLDLATFKAWVECGKLPKPIPDCGKYDLKAIDQAVDRISGLGSSSGEGRKKCAYILKGLIEPR